MGGDRANLLMRREILYGYVKVLERPADLLAVCASVSGGIDDAQRAVADAFHVNEVVAVAILDLQVRRFTPAALTQMRDEIAELDRQLFHSGRSEPGD